MKGKRERRSSNFEFRISYFASRSTVNGQRTTPGIRRDTLDRRIKLDDVSRNCPGQRDASGMKRMTPLPLQEHSLHEHPRFGLEQVNGL